MRPERQVNRHLHLVPRLGINGVTKLTTLSFVACTGENFTFALGQMLYPGCNPLSVGCLRHIEVFGARERQYSQERHYTVLRNIEGRSCNNSCSGKPVSITYSECVSVALGVRHAMRMRHIVICGSSGSTMILRIVS